MNILFITTGGTIAGNVRNDNADHTGGDAMSDAASKAVDAIREQWGTEVAIETRAVDDIDSSDVTPELWTAIAELIKAEYDNYDGFVITHGTNTMGYTSAALSFAIANSSKPIVLTGSQIPFGRPGTDALINVENAVRIAAYPATSAQISGVIVVFGSHLISGIRAKKSTEFDLDAFQTFSAGSLGRIGRILDLDEVNLKKHQKYIDDNVGAMRASNLIVQPNFRMDGIMSITEFPGLSCSSLIAAAKAWKSGGRKLEGVVIRAFGAGDVSKHRWDFLQYLKDAKVPICITTQAPNGKATFTVNEHGAHISEESLGIPAHDMSIETITVKLGWLIAQDLSYADVNRLMTQDLRGEISVARERPW